MCGALAAEGLVKIGERLLHAGYLAAQIGGELMQDGQKAPGGGALGAAAGGSEPELTGTTV